MVKSINSNDSWLEGQKALLHILGARLTSVQFVLNYLILGFDGKGALTLLVWPEVIGKGKAIQYGASQYRDHLCELITQVVQTASVDIDDTINIDFVNGTQLAIPLKTFAGNGERAILTAPKHFLYVF